MAQKTIALNVKKGSPQTSSNCHTQKNSHGKPLIPQDALPDKFDPNNYCSPCTKAFKCLQYYRTHLKMIHKMKLTPHRPKPNFNIIPNPNNSSNYCDSCKWTYSSRNKYLLHLKTVHNISQQPKRNPEITPNIDDPNFYCISCRYSYKSRAIYRQHLQCVHKMELTPVNKHPLYDSTISVEDVKKSKKHKLYHL